MTRLLYLEDAYLRDAPGRILSHTSEGGAVLDATIFFAKGGGQPGDSGRLLWDGKVMPVATAVFGDGDSVVIVPAEPVPLPPVGAHVMQRLDWERRHRHMRVHTALHLLSAVIPLPVIGGAIGAGSGRLDFTMSELPESEGAVEAALNELVDLDLVVGSEIVEEAVLTANPEILGSMTVKPPRGRGPVRMVRIGEGARQVDLQPCNGTHVARTGEIGRIRLGRIESKGRQTRRINLHLD